MTTERDYKGQGEGQATWAGLVNERDALRAEVERLRDHRDHYLAQSVRLRAEVERLKQDCRDVQRTYSEMEQELEAAREALREIANIDSAESRPASIAAIAARAALTKQEEGGWRWP